MRFVSATMLTSFQFGATGLALAAFALWPPVSGKLLLVPLDGGDRNMVARLAVAGGAALLDRGPVPGSMVVVGRPADIAHHARRWRILILAAPAVGCGDRTLWSTVS